MNKFSIKIDKETVWKVKKPLYNGYKCGYGVHGDTKYNRNKQKEKFKRELDNDIFFK